MADQFIPSGAIDVLHPGEWENDEGPKGFYAVCDDSGGIFAYAADWDMAWAICNYARLLSAKHGRLGDTVQGSTKQFDAVLP